jgi:nucleoside-diphosphate-sugar epimerase
MRILVTGAGGFIGTHLVRALKAQGHWVRGVDLQEPAYCATDADQFLRLDLRWPEEARPAMTGVEHVYHLAANMGGIGFIEANKGQIVHDNTLINMQTIHAALGAGVKRFLFTSSACIYPGYRQNALNSAGLTESMAYPADPEDGYGWEKLYFERVCRHYREDFALDTRVARFHNIYGPLGTYDGGREKSPAAICRKVAAALDGGMLEIWGDGRQERSYCYVSDCVDALIALMESDYHKPLNIGSDRRVSVDELANIIIDHSGKRLDKAHDLSKAVGVRSRNSDNTECKKVLGWEPKVSLEDGLGATYDWIAQQLKRAA